MRDHIVVPYLRPAVGRPRVECYHLAGAVADRPGTLSIDHIHLNVTARRR